MTQLVKGPVLQAGIDRGVTCIGHIHIRVMNEVCLMPMVVRCRDCNKELVSHPTKTQCCGCPNMMTVCGNSLSGLDLSRIVMVSSTVDNKKSSVLTKDDIAWQEQRRQRKVRKLDFEIR